MLLSARGEGIGGRLLIRVGTGRGPSLVSSTEEDVMGANHCQLAP